MSKGYAVYEIVDGDHTFRIRFFNSFKKSLGLTDQEIEFAEIAAWGFCDARFDGVGRSIDPYEAAEVVFSERFDSARIVEKHYEWQPNQNRY